MLIGGHALNSTDTHNLRIHALSLFGSALSTFHSFVGGILRLAIPAIRSARAFPIVGSIIDIPLSFYDLGVGVKQWWKSPDRKISGLYQATIGFMIDSLINAEGLGAAIAPLAFAVAGPILLLTGFGLATLYFANELKSDIKEFMAAKKSGEVSNQKSAKRKMWAHGGFMLGAMALVGAVAAVTFSPAGPAAAMAFSGVFIGIALYRLVIKLVRPVPVSVTVSSDTKTTQTEAEDTAKPSTDSTPGTAPLCLSDSQPKTIEMPAAVAIGAALGFDIPKSRCYAA